MLLAKTELNVVCCILLWPREETGKFVHRWYYWQRKYRWRRLSSIDRSFLPVHYRGQSPLTGAKFLINGGDVQRRLSVIGSRAKRHPDHII